MILKIQISSVDRQRICTGTSVILYPEGHRGYHMFDIQFLYYVTTKIFPVYLPLTFGLDLPIQAEELLLYQDYLNNKIVYQSASATAAGSVPRWIILLAVTVTVKSAFAVALVLALYQSAATASKAPAIVPDALPLL